MVPSPRPWALVVAVVAAFDAGGITGTVDEIRLVSTTLTTGDNKLITIPNSLIFNGTITNYSAKETRRLDLLFGVGYDGDLKVAAEVLNKICREHPKVLTEPANGCAYSQNLLILSKTGGTVSWQIKVTTC